LPPPLLRPVDVTATLLPDSTVLLGFSLYRRPGMGTPTTAEVCTDRGTGVIDMETPVATIDVSDIQQTSFQTLVAAQALPAQFAVRARKDSQTGPLSHAVTVRAARTPPPPTIL